MDENDLILIFKFNPAKEMDTQMNNYNTLTIIIHSPDILRAYSVSSCQAVGETRLKRNMLTRKQITG